MVSKAAKEILQFPVLIEKGEDGFFVAECPVLQGCLTQGKTINETLKNIREAIELCIEDNKDEIRSQMKMSKGFGFYMVDVKV
ncbi:HicB_like antitoxin of bacterial toxin-antitoxin system [uncultured archaeon]|nr:HicB_like antitoxin of bacterial toxin-antitoxin system [uncultured archaeon]